jgi:hypothetical protein
MMLLDELDQLWRSIRGLLGRSVHDSSDDEDEHSSKYMLHMIPPNKKERLGCPFLD